MDTDNLTLRENAAWWFGQLSVDEVSQATRTAFTRWLDASPEHAQAYASVSRAWDFAKLNAHDPEILALRHETALRLTRKSSARSHSWYWGLAAASLSLGAFLGVLLWPKLSNDHGWVAHLLQNGGQYRTETGERLMARMADGSQVTLNTDTELATVFTAKQRRVVLKSGQAYFEVAKDKSRPFVVEANGRRFVAIGTAFDVRVDAERVQVTMMEGTVRVEPAGKEVIPATTLTAGEQLTVERKHQERIRTANAVQVTSWRRGQVIFEDSRLLDAITEINRYSKTPIRLDDPTLVNLHISGAFATGDPKMFIEALTSYFPIRVIQDSDQIMLSRVGER